MTLLLDKTEEFLLRMNKVRWKSLKRIESSIFITTWWTNARHEHIPFYIIPEKDLLMLTDQGETLTLPQEESPGIIGKRKGIFLNDLLLALDIRQEGKVLQMLSTLPNLENSLLSFTQALITIHGFTMIEKI